MTDIATGSLAVLEGDPLAGTGYRAVRRIGAGAMGQVFEAEQTGLRRKVAVKLLAPALAGDPALVDRTRLEAQALASVRHPNVVLVHDHARTPGGIPFLVMEMLHGRTLDDLLQERQALPLPEALPLLDQVFRGLGAIHAAGLTHRDLKPSNVFLAEEDGRTTVKLLDLGIVKLTPKDTAHSLAPLRFPTREGHAVGTPRCMAPEQILGEGCDARTDVYAAGVLVFLVLAGRDPFHHRRSNLEVLSAHLTETPPLLSQVASQRLPAALDEVVRRALAKAPAQRFATLADFGAALGAAAAGTGRGGTEKIPATTWNRGPAGTVPIDPALFRGGGALPFAPGKAVRAPSFGLPPLASGPALPREAEASGKRQRQDPPRGGAFAMLPGGSLAGPLPAHAQAASQRAQGGARGAVWARFPRLWWLLVAVLLGGGLALLGSRVL